MTKAQIQVAQPLSLFRLVFGFKPGQTLSEFAAECTSLKGDAKFVAEVRDYALAQASE